MSDNKIIWSRTKLLLLVLSVSAAGNLKAQFLGKTGLRWDDTAYQNEPKLSLGVNKPVLPPIVSLKNITPYPGNQGECNTCVGWAVAYAAFTTYANYGKPTIDRRRISNFAFSPSFINVILHKSTAEPLKIKDALEVLKLYGDCLDKDLKLNCDNSSTSKPMLKNDELERLKKVAFKNKVNGYETLFPLNAENGYKVAVTKNSLANGQPVIIGIGVYFPSIIKITTKDSVWHPDLLHEKYVGGHAVCVVGYNDFSKTFEVINSWGQDWGNKGFFSISYNDFASVVKYGYRIILRSRGPKNIGLYQSQPDSL